MELPWLHGFVTITPIINGSVVHWISSLHDAYFMHRTWRQPNLCHVLDGQPAYSKWVIGLKNAMGSKEYSATIGLLEQSHGI
jgi:hypothetical protein